MRDAERDEVSDRLYDLSRRLLIGVAMVDAGFPAPMDVPARLSRLRDDVVSTAIELLASLRGMSPYELVEQMYTEGVSEAISSVKSNNPPDVAEPYVEALNDLREQMVKAARAGFETQVQ